MTSSCTRAGSGRSGRRSTIVSVMAVTGLVLPAELETAAQYVFQSDALGWGWGYRAVDFDETFFDATKTLGFRSGGSAPEQTWHSGVKPSSGSDSSTSGWARARPDAARTRSCGTGCWRRVTGAATGRPRSCSTITATSGRTAPPDVQLHARTRRGPVLSVRAVPALGKRVSRVRRSPVVPATLALRETRVARLFYDRATARLAASFPQILGALAGYGYYLRHRSARQRRASSVPHACPSDDDARPARRRGRYRPSSG